MIRIEFTTLTPMFMLTFATTGWEHGNRSQYTTLHVRLRDGKIWIEEDGTQEGLANRLLEEKTPAEDIVLAFVSPEMRRYTEFAVA